MTFQETNLDDITNLDGKTFCAVHPTVETTLRCNKCGRYMCTRCVVRTPVGYRCKECVHQQQDVYFTANQVDYIIAGAVSFMLGLPVAYLMIRFGLFIIIFFSLPAGALISELVQRATRHRRGRYTWMIVGGGIVLAAAVVVFFPAIQTLMAMSSVRRLGGDSGTLLFQIVGTQLLSAGVYTVLCAGAAISRLRYGK